MLSWIHVILEEGLYDAEFVSHWTNGPALVWTDTLALLEEADVYEGGGDERDILPYPASVADRRNRRPLMVWDIVSGSVRSADTGGVEPALFGTFEVGGRECKTALQLLRERASLYPPEETAEICWTGSAEKIRQAARLYAISPSACSDVGSFGIQGLEGGHPNTFHILRAQFCLAALTGNINRPGGEVGTPHWRWITGTWARTGGPRSMTPWGAPDDDFDCLMEGPHPEEPALGEYPLQPGLTSMIDGFRAMKSGEPYPIKAYVMVQGNPLGGWCEDQTTVREGLLTLDFLVDMDLYITPTNSLADIVLPAALGPFEKGPDRCIEPLYENGRMRGSMWSSDIASIRRCGRGGAWRSGTSGRRPRASGTSTTRPRRALPWKGATWRRPSIPTLRSTRRAASRSGSPRRRDASRSTASSPSSMVPILCRATWSRHRARIRRRRSPRTTRSS